MRWKIRIREIGTVDTEIDLGNGRFSVEEICDLETTNRFIEIEKKIGLIDRSESRKNVCMRMLEIDRGGEGGNGKNEGTMLNEDDDGIRSEDIAADTRKWK